MSFEIKRYAAAGYPVVAVETYEEERLVKSVVESFQVAGGVSRHILLWDMIGGLRRCTKDADKGAFVELAEEPYSDTISDASMEGAIKYILYNETYQKRSAVLILQDPHVLLNDPGSVRFLRVVQPALKERGHLLIMTAPSWNLPVELRCEVTTLDFRLPDTSALEKLVERFIKTNVVEVEASRYIGLTLPETIKQSAAEALQGLTSLQAENALSLAVTTMTSGSGLLLDSTFVQLLFTEKVQQLKTGLLEHIPTEKCGLVGGLEPLRDWAKTRHFSFTKQARDMGLPYPNGVVLVGVPGCGKTLMAGEFARSFNLPLFKLDIGRLFASKVGETESLTREVIRQMNSIGGAVILIDELEKSLSKNATNGAGDSGTSSRMFGTLLNWLSTKQCPVFLVATSNNLDALPPELTRVGRFDAVFWVDLPTRHEREAILKLSFKAYHDVPSTALPSLAEKLEGYTGAEIVALVNETTLRYFGGPSDAYKGYVDFLQANMQLVKAQQNGKEEMKSLRETVETRGWLRANPAAREGKTKSLNTGRKLNLHNN